MSVLHDLWVATKAERFGLTLDEFGTVLESVGAKLNYGLPPGSIPNHEQRTKFLQSLHLEELALARGCALGRESAWERFVQVYRAPLNQAAIAITGSATLGREFADSLYSELYGLREFDGARCSPLASYSGRGSLLGWLRTTLAQRHIDYHRRTHREIPLDTIDAPACLPTPPPAPAELGRVANAVMLTLQDLPPEDRFVLSAYFLDRQTLLGIARTLGVHEATISRRIKRVTANLREQLLRNLRSGGLSQGAAEEALGIDPRDIEINLRALLQTSQVVAFSEQKAASPSAVSDSHE